MSNDLQKNFDTIDLFKFIGSIMIFVMHAGAFDDFGIGVPLAWEMLTRWAVPFFFVASSFFLFLNGKENLIYAGRKYIKRILMLYGIWFIINIPSIYVKQVYGKDLSKISSWFIILKNFILSSTFSCSWYLSSCIFSCILIVFLCRKLSTKSILILTGIIQLVCIFSSVWGGVLPANITEILSFLRFPINIMSGCFYFALGKLLAEKRDIISNFAVRKSTLLFIASGILYVIEVLVAEKAGFYCSSDQSFFVVPYAVFLFIIALNSKISLNGKARTLRKASTVIFCAQGNLLVLKIIFTHIIDYVAPGFKYTNIVSFCPVAILMAIVVIIVFKLQSEKVKFSQYLT